MESTNSPKCMKIKHSHTFAYIFHSSVDNKAVFGDKTMRRKIHWDKNSQDYWIAIDSVRIASPWDGVYRQENWDD